MIRASTLGTAMGQIEKACVFCAQSCAGQPRIKDAQGNYAHKACADKHNKKQQAKELAAQKQTHVAALDLSPEEEPEMAAFLDDLPSASDSETTGGIRAACPGCGASISSETIVCMSCGCNTKTGRGAKTKVAKSKSRSSGGGANIAAKAGSLAVAPFLPIIGAVIGGAIGAAVWAAIAHFTGYEIGYVATGVGVVCGLGAAITSGGGNAWAGAVAVVVALLAIITGKTIVNEIYVGQLESIKEVVQSEMTDQFTLDFYTPDDVILEFADEIIFEREDKGRPIIWPTEDMTWEEALWPDDYPKDVIAQANQQWEDMGEEAQLEHRQARIDEMQSYAEEFNTMIDEEMETASASVLDNLTLFDGLWALLALAAAWQLGSGGALSED